MQRPLNNRARHSQKLDKQQKVAMFAIKTAVVLSALDAIAVAGVPLGWVSVFVPIISVFFVQWNQSGISKFLILITAWAIIVQFGATVANFMNFIPSYQMPVLSTAPYPAFILLRFVPFFMFASLYVALSKLNHSLEEIHDFITNFGALVALVAIYIYFAQLFGWPDIPRNRVGTDGLEVTEVSFTYSFHRALGTFREPSYLGTWLSLPLFLSFRKYDWKTYIIGGTILLTGSMTAYMSIAFGAITAWIFIYFKHIKGESYIKRIPIIIIPAALVSLAIFSLSVNADDDYTGLGSIIFERMSPVLEHGIQDSDRGYVYEFVSDIGVPIFGYGLGNSNLLLSEWMNSLAVPGMLSLYLNILVSLGIPGIVLLTCLLAAPLFKDLSEQPANLIYPLYATYFSWLMAFLVHGSEFQLVFCLSYVLIDRMRVNY